jgi:tRNA(Ile)-lysidine synthase
MPNRRIASNATAPAGDLSYPAKGCRPRTADKKPATTSMNRSLPRAEHALIEDVLRAFPGGHPQGPVLAAVSGGSDSMAMLELLASAARWRHFALAAAYVDHGLRPEASREASFVRATASRHGIDFHRLEIRGAADDGEAQLREQRYARLGDLAAAMGEAWIATGHTRDDQIETVLLRLLRGSGRRGMAGIPVRRERIVRPLLGLSRGELRDFLRARGIGWLEDASNAGTRYTRNRLRHRVLPVIERELGRGAIDHLPELADRWRLEEEYLAAEAARFAAFAIVERPEGPVLDLTGLDAAPAALRPHVLRAWLARVGGGRSPSLAQLEALERLVAERDGSATVTVAGVAVAREYATVRARLARCRSTAPPFSYPVVADRLTVIEPSSRAWRVVVDPEPREQRRIAATPYHHEVDADPVRLPATLELRSPRPSDVIECARRGGRRKVCDMMIDRQVPRDLRADWPVLAGSGRILWVPGLAIAPEIAATASIERAIRLRWLRSNF